MTEQKSELTEAQERNVRFAKEDLMQFAEDKRRGKFWGRCIRACREGFTDDMIHEHLVPIALEVGVIEKEAKQAVASARRKFNEEAAENGGDDKGKGPQGNDPIPF